MTTTENKPILSETTCADLLEKVRILDVDIWKALVKPDVNDDSRVEVFCSIRSHLHAIHKILAKNSLPWASFFDNLFPGLDIPPTKDGLNSFLATHLYDKFGFYRSNILDKGTEYAKKKFVGASEDIIEGAIGAWMLGRHDT